VKRRRAVLLLWSALALANLSAGVVLAWQPDRASDLETMHRWGKAWLVDGRNPYGDADEAPDYPPHGLVALAPIGLLPAGWLVPVWGVVNLAIAVLTPYLAVRAFDPTIRFATAAVPILMFLCWGTFRILLQFSLLTFALGLLAMVLADKRPIASGVCLGLALLKPQLAVPFFCWMLFTRHVRVAIVAIAVVLAGFVIFCLRAHANPVAVVDHWRQNLQLLYTGDAILSGISDLRPLIRLTVSNLTLVDAIAGSIALAIFVAICVMGFEEARWQRAVIYCAPPLVGLWSLMTFYFLTYGFLLFLPTAVLLIFARDPQTRRVRMIMFSVLQALLMVDVPGLWRRIGHLAPAWPVLHAVAPHFDRVLPLAAFASVVMLYRRARQLSHGRESR
jgi:Glycosyltransferase family 87